MHQKRLKIATLSLVGLMLSPGLMMAQQQMQQQSEFLQFNFQFDNNLTNQIQLEQNLSALEPLSSLDALSANIGISPEEEKAFQESITNLYNALAPNAGDNLMAASWSLEEGQIIKMRGGLANNKEVLQFDKASGQSPKEFVEKHISRSVVAIWRSQRLYGVRTADKLIHVRVGDMLPMTQLVFKPTENGYQIVSVAFIGFGC